MQLLTKTFPNIKPYPLLFDLVPIKGHIFIDIETTGLSRENSNIYLIGCGYFDDKGYNTIQWFADDYTDERIILLAFYEYLSGKYSHLIHFNGNKFDIPFLEYRTRLYNIAYSLDSLINVDLYEIIKPYKNIIGLTTLNQRNIESFLNIYSDDQFNGGELIKYYHSYVKNLSEDYYYPLIHHNSEDLLGMAKILPILFLKNTSNCTFTYKEYYIHNYSDYNGQAKQELLITYSHNLIIPVSFVTTRNEVVISMRKDNTAILRVPVISDTLKLFYSNYKDYYYLPLEDCCIHKSVAEGVDKAHRIQAKKETCYIKKQGFFIPNIFNNENLSFRTEFNSKNEYILLNSKNNLNDYLTKHQLQLNHIF